MGRTRTWGRVGGVGIGAALLGAVGIGVVLRWVLAGAVVAPLEFAHLRHAHSHLGYYAVLFPLAWLGWRAAGAPAPGRWLTLGYAVATAVSIVGFLRAGYGPEAIAGSTVVGAVWLVSAWRLRRRLWRVFDPLALVLPGVVLAEACVPFIALNVRRAPDTAYAFVSTFLAMLLLVVVVPSALAARRTTAGPWPVVLATAVLGAVSLGVWSGAVARLGLAGYAGLLGWAAVRGRLPAHLRVVWGAVALGLVGLAAGVIPNVRPVAIGAIHFLVLAPVLGSLAPLWLRRSPPEWAWFVGHGCAAAMSAALVAQGFGLGAWTVTAAAVGGTAVAAWWLAVLALQALDSLPIRR